MLNRCFLPFLFAFFLFLLLISPVKSDDFVEQLRRDVLGKRENDPERNRRLANLLDRQGLPEDALLYYRRAAELLPQSPVYQRDLANSLKKLGRTDEAIGVYRSLVETEPANSQTVAGFVSLLEETGNFEEAESVYFRLIKKNDDPRLRMGWISQLADLALRHQRIDGLLKTVMEESFIPNQGERALLLSQIYMQCGQTSEALRVLEEELLREEKHGETVDLLLLDRLVDVTFLTGDISANLKYNNFRASLNPTAENLKETEESEKRFNGSLEAKKDHYSSNPKEFLDDLPQLLLSQNSGADVIPFALSFLPEIPMEMIAESFLGIRILFREIFFSRQEFRDSAVTLWKQLRKHFEALPDSKRAITELYVSLIGIPSESGKLLSDELTNDFSFLLNEHVLWEGYWASDGWKSLFETLLESVSTITSISAMLNSDDSISQTEENTRRAQVVLLFHQHDYSQRTYEEFRSLNLSSPSAESLSADWTLFHEMKDVSDPAIQHFLAEAYRVRIPLTANTPDERFVVLEYRKAALASGDSEQIKTIAAPLLNRLEQNFILAALADSTGNITQTDSETGESHVVSIYEVLNELLDTAIELKSLGLSKEVAVMYHRYGAKEGWWTNQEGQGVFFFEELKKIVSESE